MKKEIISILLVAFIVTFVACKPVAPTLFDQPDAVYFNSASDSVAYTFAKYPNRTVDTIKLPVNVLGNPNNLVGNLDSAKITITPGPGNPPVRT